MADALSIFRAPHMRALIFIGICTTISFSTALTAVPLWALQNGADAALIGLPIGAMLVATVATQMFVPALLVRINGGVAQAGSLLALGAPALLYGTASHLWVLALIGAVRGIGFAVLTVTGTALAARLAPTGRQGEALGLYSAGNTVPALLCVPAGAAIAGAQLYGYAWAVAAMPLLAIPAALMMRRVAAFVPAEPSSRRRIDAARRGWPTMIVIVATMAGYGGLTTYLPVVLNSGSMAPVALLVEGIAACLSRWRIGSLADRYGSRLLLPLSIVSASAGLAVVGGGLNSSGVIHVAGLLAGCLLFGLGAGAVATLTAIILLSRVPTQDAPVASATWNLSVDGGTAAGPLLFGLMTATVGTVAGFIGAAFCIAAAFLAANARRTPDVDNPL